MSLNLYTRLIITDIIYTYIKTLKAEFIYNMMVKLNIFVEDSIIVKFVLHPGIDQMKANWPFKI